MSGKFVSLLIKERHKITALGEVQLYRDHRRDDHGKNSQRSYDYHQGILSVAKGQNLRGEHADIVPR